MKHLESLASANLEIISTLLGEDYAEAASNDHIEATRVIEANHVLEDFLYGTEVANLVRSNSRQQLNAQRTEIIESVALPERKLSGLNLAQLGIVVIRPEALDLSATAKELLLKNGLTTIIDKTTQINFHQYWSLYGPGMVDPDARNDFPTRTLNYINRNIQVFVVKGDPTKLGADSVSDYITKEIKGRQGSFTANTLRGDVAYTALRDFITNDGDAFKAPVYALALDPIGAYRKLIRNEIPSDRMHASADNQLLFYAGQSMHTPNSSEIMRDSRILLTEEEVEQIKEGF